jgi:hypothetical protein
MKVSVKHAERWDGNGSSQEWDASYYEVGKSSTREFCVLHHQ